MVKFRDKFEWQNELKPELDIEEAWSGTWTCPRPIKALVLVHMDWA
jgi:hypothetical protein